MRPLRRAQRDAYLISRAAGDADALSRGPGVYLKRVARRTATRQGFSLARSILRGLR